jgi:hypothetical protein
MTDDFLVLLLFVATNKDLLHHSRLSYRLGDSRLFFFPNLTLQYEARYLSQKFSVPGPRARPSRLVLCALGL